jgi:alpha-beta hydrolase superfamily lysophospholipase
MCAAEVGMWASNRLAHVPRLLLTGFGLTSEPPATPQGDALYSFEHNAVLGQALVEAEVLKMGGLPHKGMVYAGHSMGGITSSYQALQHVYGNEGNATSAAVADGQPPTVLVLIAPALIAMNAPLKPTTKGAPQSGASCRSNSVYDSNQHVDG